MDRFIVHTEVTELTQRPRSFFKIIVIAAKAAIALVPQRDSGFRQNDRFFVALMDNVGEHEQIPKNPFVFFVDSLCLCVNDLKG